MYVYCTEVWSIDNNLQWEKVADSLCHRVSTAREEKGWGQCFFRQIEPIWPLPYSTVPVPRLRDARPMGWVTYWIAVYAWVQRRDPKTGQEKVQFYCKDNSLFLSSYYLSVVYVHCTVHHKSLYSKSLAKTTDSATKSAKLRITRICSKYKIILINIVLFIELLKFFINEI